MDSFAFLARCCVQMLLFLTTICRFSDCYDPLDPNGNITVTFDVLLYVPNGYLGRVTIQNYYQYRHVGNPGWKLGWTWEKNEVILSMSGAFAIEKGNCSIFNQVPHSCKPEPVISDLMPDLPDSTSQIRPDGCCRGGILTAWAINPSIIHPLSLRLETWSRILLATSH